MAWEYEGLFNSRIPGTSDLVTAAMTGDMDLRVGQMGYRTRTTTAGTRLEAELFPIYGRAKMGIVRQAKKNQTKEAQERASAPARETPEDLRVVETPEGGDGDV